MIFIDDVDLFETIILSVANEYGIDASIIEKDYYVSLLLKEINNQLPNIVFKGGTSLSKCYHLIDRFSEDIDLTVKADESLTEGKKKAIRDGIVNSINRCGLQLENREEIRSRRDFNRYIIKYPTIFKSLSLNQKLIIETSYFTKAYPTETKEVNSYVYSYLRDNLMLKKLKIDEIAPHKIFVQKPERTLIDKVFAICDYYMLNEYDQHSRHLYDIYRILEVVNLDSRLKKLIGKVRSERKELSKAPSSQDSVSINEILNEIITKDVYKYDYQRTTEDLLFEMVEYDEALSALKKIVSSNVFV